MHQQNHITPEQTNDKPYKYTGINHLYGAVQHGDLKRLKRLAPLKERLAPLKEGMEDRNYKGGKTPLMFAAASGSWEDAEILLDNGANPWAYDKFGFVIDAGDFRSPTTERDAEAYWRVREKLLKMGYPLHTPRSDDILKLASEGKWPPAFVSEDFKRTSRP